ncbi:MAG: restriction endonuclease subunit S, partial [Shewanella sp.]|nr:restriction endonuclease subunit S [Shewanella sp.]
RMIKRCFPEAGDIFISCSGSIGRVCEVPENFSCALVRSVALVKLDNNLVQSSYICWWLRTEKMQKAMINSALQAAQPNLFQGAIEQLDVVLCAPEEQLLISERLNVIESMMLLNKSDLKKLKVQKAGLMQDLLTGKVPVPA